MSSLLLYDYGADVLERRGPIATAELSRTHS
jgi:hypothetical protein